MVEVDLEVIKVLGEEVYNKAFTLAYRIEDGDWGVALELLREICEIYCNKILPKVRVYGGVKP